MYPRDLTLLCVGKFYNNYNYCVDLVKKRNLLSGRHGVSIRSTPVKYFRVIFRKGRCDGCGQDECQDGAPYGGPHLHKCPHCSG